MFGPELQARAGFSGEPVNLPRTFLSLDFIPYLILSHNFGDLARNKLGIFGTLNLLSTVGVSIDCGSLASAIKH